MTAETQPATRRRKFQFSLRTMLFVVMPCACVLAWYSAERRTAYQQTKAIEWVEEVGGEVTLDNRSRKNWRSYMLGDLYPGVVSEVDLDLRPLYLPPEMKIVIGRPLSLRTTPPPSPPSGQTGDSAWSVKTTENIAPLAALPDLKELQIVGWDQGDLRPLAGMSRLERLYLRGTQVEDLTPLIGLVSLRELNLRQTPARDFEPLAELSQLEWLTIEADRDNRSHATL